MDTLLAVFLIAVLGYLLGSITIKGINLGSAMILIVSLVFGHYGIVTDSIIKNLGLILFVGSVGLIAGSVFFENFKNGAFHYIIIGIMIVLSGGLTTFITAKLFRIPAGLSVGIFNGALTSTPGLAAALDISSDSSISIGYGVTYLFGVIGVVLFVQLLPRFLGKDMQKEAAEYVSRLQGNDNAAEKNRQELKEMESGRFLVFTVVMTLGILVGMLKVPLPGGRSFSLGITGGPLFAGIMAGHLGKVGDYSIKVPASTLTDLREWGLMLFLIGAGTEAGQGFIAILQEYGVILFFQGAFITLVPMIFVTIVALKIFKMDLISILGSICGGMTSTPALGTLISSAKTDAVSIAYASTYPVALILVVLTTQILLAIL